MDIDSKTARLSVTRYVMTPRAIIGIHTFFTKVQNPEQPDSERPVQSSAEARKPSGTASSSPATCQSGFIRLWECDSLNDSARLDRLNRFDAPTMTVANT